MLEDIFTVRTDNRSRFSVFQNFKFYKPACFITEKEDLIRRGCQHRSFRTEFNAFFKALQRFQSNPPEVQTLLLRLKHPCLGTRVLREL